MPGEGAQCCYTSQPSYDSSMLHCTSVLLQSQPQLKPIVYSYTTHDQRTDKYNRCVLVGDNAELFVSNTFISIVSFIKYIMTSKLHYEEYKLHYDNTINVIMCHHVRLRP